MATSQRNPSLSLSDEVAFDLRQRIEVGEWLPGEKLDGEHALADHYGVSRATIRTALQGLGSRGATLTRHGHGTVVMASATSDQSDIRRLESMTDTIRNQGRKPDMRYRSILVREADESELEALRMSPGEEVLATERAIMADGELIGFSHDVTPLKLLGNDFDLSEVSGSLFALLDSRGVRTMVAVTELHADHGPHIGWGDRPEDASYLKLVQIHSDSSGEYVFFATTYFVEGRFQFGLVRHR